jgi:CRISPR-associated protein Csx17
MRCQIALTGCPPEPLASYLKSLSLLRLVSEQKDSSARGWWERDVFHIESELDQVGLLRFFLEEYSPTPIVAPWNGGSGFYEGKDVTGREAIRASTSERLRHYRDTINEILSWPEISATAGLSLRKMLDLVKQEAAKTTGKRQSEMLKPVEQMMDRVKSVSAILAPNNPLELPITMLEKEKHKSRDVGQLIKAASKVLTIVKKHHRSAAKEELVRLCRNRLSDKAVEWIDASAVLMESFENDKLIEEFSALPLTGTGGNEGNQDYTNAFMRHLAELLLAEHNAENIEKLLRHALFDEISPGLVRDSVGQHDPGRAGGYNQGYGIELKNFPMNPWNFVLTLEGSIAWASGVTRRQGLATRSGISSAFTVMPTAVGYPSASAVDKGKARREVWTPLWQRPARYMELQAILREGRADIGKRQAVSGIEFAESVASLGIDRGITEFVRYSFLERRGKGYYVALPSGRFPVQARSEADLVRNLEPLLVQVDRFLSRFKKNEPPARFTSRRREVDETIYQLLLRGGTVYAKAVIAAIGRLERLFAERDRDKEPKLRSPLSGLDPRWLLAADDGSLEIRIAAALASIGPTDKIGSLRANLTAIDPEKPWSWSNGYGQTAWTGNSLARRLANVLHRRMMDAERLQCRANPTWGGIALRAEDIAAFIEGGLDESLIEDLLFGFTLTHWDGEETCQKVKGELRARWARPVTRRVVPRSWALLKHLFLSAPLTTTSGQGIIIRPESAIIPLLCANRVSQACEIASRRLFSAGLAPTRARIPDGENGTRIAAALLVPVRRLNDLSKLVLHREEDHR